MFEGGLAGGAGPLALGALGGPPLGALDGLAPEVHLKRVDEHVPL